MAYDTYSAEITALDGVGDKLSAAITNAETRTASFDACVMSATAKTSGMTQKLPSGAYITSLVITEYTEGGAATLDIGISGGAKDDVLDGIDGAVSTVYPVNKVAAGGSEVYAISVGDSITFGGYITYIVI